MMDADTDMSSIKVELGIAALRDSATLEEDQVEPLGAEVTQDNNSIMKKTSVSVNRRREKRAQWQSSVENKSSLLTTAWNELYNILGEYKADLISKDNLEERYDTMSDMDQMRHELLEKDHALIEREHENQDLRDQLAEFQRKYEQLQMDVSVKESLLKKYQEDLLSKESALMQSNTKTTRLEGRLRMLESKAGTEGEEPPRKMMRSQTQAVKSHMATRTTPGSTVKALSPGGRLFATPARSPASRVMANAAMARRRVQQAQAAQRARSHPSTSAPAKASDAQVICIEVDDTSELEEVTEATQEVGGESIYMGVWPEQEAATDENDTGMDTPGTSQSFQEMSDLSTDGSTDRTAWPVEMTSAGDMSQMQPSPSNANRKTTRSGRVTRPTPKKEACDADNLTTPGSTTCPHCTRIFQNTSNMRRHIREVHQDERKFPCETCGFIFKRQEDRRVHMKTHEEGQGNKDQELKCEYCQAVLKGLKALTNHIKVLHAHEMKQEDNMEEGQSKKDSPRERHVYRCKTCDSCFSTMSFLNTHSRSEGHDQEPRTCSICAKVMSSVGAKLRHEKEFHSSGSTPCGICDRMYKSAEDTVLHRKRHAYREFPCLQCSFKFICKKHLDRHVENQHASGLILSNKKFDFKCEICFKYFRSEMALDNHLSTHAHAGHESGVGFLCELCGKLLSDVVTKKQHLVEVHGKAPTLSCLFCGRQFKRSEDLDMHIRRHDREKQFPCASCEKVFICRRQLERHVATEHPDLIICTDCTQCFASVDLMKEHSRQDHLPNYSCPCGKLFKKRQSLMRHAKLCKNVNEETSEIVQYYCTTCSSLVPDQEHKCGQPQVQVYEMTVEETDEQQKVIYKIVK